MALTDENGNEDLAMSKLIDFAIPLGESYESSPIIDEIVFRASREIIGLKSDNFSCYDFLNIAEGEFTPYQHKVLKTFFTKVRPDWIESTNSAELIMKETADGCFPHSEKFFPAPEFTPAIRRRTRRRRSSSANNQLFTVTNVRQSTFVKQEIRQKCFSQDWEGIEVSQISKSYLSFGPGGEQI